ncbi:unnamed protein product [Closterium sp. Naga37s-1]|nr:unnamed protein product [Closterium sp. Naga37s-1]
MLVLSIPSTVTASNRLPGFTSHVDSTAKHSGSSSSSSSSSSSGSGGDGGGGGGRGNRSHGVAIDRGIEEEGSVLGLAVDWSEEERGRMERSGRAGTETRWEERAEDTGKFWVKRRVGGVRRAGERVGKEHAVRGGRRRAGGRGRDGGISNGRGLQERRRKRGGRRGGVGGGKEGGRVRECEGVMVGEWPGVDGLAAVGALMAVRARRVREGRGGERGRVESESGAGVGAAVPWWFLTSPMRPLRLTSPPLCTFLRPIPHPPLFPAPPLLAPSLLLISSCAVVGPHLSHAPSAPHLGAAIDSHALVLRMGQHTPPTRLQAYVLGSRTDMWMEVGGRGGGAMHGSHEVGGGAGGGGTGRGLTKGRGRGAGRGGGRGGGRGVGRRRLLGLKGRSEAYLRADSSALVASPPWLPALQQLGVRRGHVGKRRGDTGAGEEDEALFLPPALTDEARRLFNAFAHRFRCAIGAPMSAHRAASDAASSTAASGAASSATAATVAKSGGAAGAAAAAGEAAIPIPIPMPRMPPHWPVLYLLLHACDKLTLFGLIRNASVHVLQSPMHVPSVRSELHRRPSLLVLESLLHALARTNLLSCCGGIEDHFCRLPPLLPGGDSGVSSEREIAASGAGGAGEVASGAGGAGAGFLGGEGSGEGGEVGGRGMGRAGQERQEEEGRGQSGEGAHSGAAGAADVVNGNEGGTALGGRSVNEEDYDEDEVDSRGKGGKVVGGQGAVEGAGWGDEYGDEGEEWGEGGEGEGGGEGTGGGDDDYEYDDDYYGVPVEELMDDLQHANAAHAQEVQQTDA